MAFSDLNTTKLGYRGEAIASEFAAFHNSIAYSAPAKSHPIDFVCLSTGKTWCLEVKTKPRMKYKDCTGFDSYDFWTYMDLPHPVYVLFVDFITQSIYGNWLSALAPFKQAQGSCYIFPLDKMIEYRRLTEKEIEELKMLNGSNYWD
jgi:hypothetical protein